MNKQELFYVRPQDVADEFIILRKDELHHLVHVLRKERGDKFLAVDGQGGVFECQIEQYNQETLKSRVLHKQHFLGEPSFKLSLALAIPKKDRFEGVVEKGTEIGLSRFIPLITKRTIVKAKSSRTQRYDRIALAAMKQCRRSLLPAIEQPTTFESLCKRSQEFEVKLIAHEKEMNQSLTDLLDKIKRRENRDDIENGILCVGPEGGFTDAEITLAESHGFGTFGLGPRRLRSETAALVASTLVLEKMGALE